MLSRFFGQPKSDCNHYDEDHRSLIVNVPARDSTLKRFNYDPRYYEGEELQCSKCKHYLNALVTDTLRKKT